jgi:hypothetical protein
MDVRRTRLQRSNIDYIYRSEGRNVSDESVHARADIYVASSRMLKSVVLL